MLPSLNSLPGDQLVVLRLVAEQAAVRGLPAYVVGGFVRDLLLKQPGLDLDIVLEGDAIGLARALARKYGGRVTAHKRFGTASWLFDGVEFDLGEPNRASRLASIDLIGARREHYPQPASLPEVTPSDLDDDLARRDFTINAMAARLDGAHFGELVDRHGGAADLQAGLVRVLHERSFRDDPTRMFRAVRYEQRYGFRIEAHTLELLAAAAGSVRLLSAERVRHELDLMLGEARAGAMLARLAELGLLHAASAQLPWNAGLQQRLERGLAADPPTGWGLDAANGGFRVVLGYALWLLDLDPPAIAQVQARLAFPGATLKSVQSAAALRVRLASLRAGSPSQWAEALEAAPLSALYALHLVSAEPALAQYALGWRHIQPRTNGETLKGLGVAPGPGYKKILRRLRAAWLDGEVRTPEQEKELLARLLAT